jgi:hypothetical protein
MRIILDTDKKQIIVPWNYAQKLEEINRIGADFGGEGFQKQTFSSYINKVWNECMADTDKHLVVAQKPVKK